MVTHPAHRLHDARFAEAAADFLAQEGEGINQYLDELRERNPFREAPSG